MKRLAAIWIVIAMMSYSCQKEEMILEMSSSAFQSERNADESDVSDEEFRYCLESGELESEIECKQAVFDRLDYYLRNNILDCHPELSPCGNQNCSNPELQVLLEVEYEIHAKRSLNFNLLLAQVNAQIEREVEQYFGRSGFPCRINGRILSSSCDLGSNRLLIELDLIDLCEI